MRRANRKAVTHRDVAERAGASTTLVSCVINGRDVSIPQETPDRVLRAIEELHDVPSATARGLRTSRTSLVAQVLFDQPSTPCAGSAVVNMDDERGMRLSTGHLIELGHRRIGHLRGGRDNWYANTWDSYDMQMYPLSRAAGDRDALWERMEAMAKGTAPIDHLRDVGSERAETMMAAMLTNRHDYELAVNIPNNGNITNLPGGAIVEVPAVVSAAGFHGLAVGALPEPVAELCRRQVTIAEMAVRAGVTGDCGLALQALTIDPMIQDPRVARKLLDAYLAAERKYVPQFFERPQWT